MMKFIFSMLVLASASGESDQVRQIGFTTQDANGFHILTVVELDDGAMAAIWRNVPGEETSRREVSYSQDSFDKFWAVIHEGALDPYLKTGLDEDLGVSVNYVVVLRQNDSEVQTYVVPKCGISPEVKSIIIGITMNLLPDGSPGLFKPCEIED